MKSRDIFKRTAQAWAFAAILLLPNYLDETSTAGDARMRSPVPLTKIALAHLTDLLIVAIIFAALMAWLRGLRAWPRARWALLILLPPLLLARNLNVIPFHFPLAAVFALGALWAAVVGILLWKYQKIAVQLRRLGSSILTGFVIFALVMTVQLGRAMFWQPGPQSFQAFAPVKATHAKRLVWILFDELAYQPVFEARDPSVHLPNFDRLRSMSTLYTDVTPIAYRTTRAVPSLLSGRQVTDVDYTADNDYLVQMGEGSRWQKFDAKTSLFGLAKSRGLTTSVVGWYLPYCPVFAGTVTECYWSNEDAQDRGPTSLQASFLENVWFPLRIMVEEAIWPRRAWEDEAAWNGEGHIASVQDIEQHALQTLADSQADIVYLHLPTPHPPAFWDRRTGKFALGGSYLDSLDFSDRLLGKLLQEMESNPRWNQTTLLVQGDHSWRTGMWRPLPGWSAEDERASRGGQWDSRPVLLVHAAGQQSPGTVSAPTSLMFVHDFVASQIAFF